MSPAGSSSLATECSLPTAFQSDVGTGSGTSPVNAPPFHTATVPSMPPGSSTPTLDHSQISDPMQIAKAHAKNMSFI